MPHRPTRRLLTLNSWPFLIRTTTPAGSSATTLAVHSGLEASLALGSICRLAALFWQVGASPRPHVRTVFWYRESGSRYGTRESEPGATPNTIPRASRGARPEQGHSSRCGASWEPLGSILEASWRPLAASWGPLGGLLGLLGGVLGRLGALLRRLAPAEAVLAASRGRLGALLGSSWAVLGASSTVLGASSGYLGALLGRLGALLEGSGAVLGPSWRLLGPSWAPESRKRRAREHLQTRCKTSMLLASGGALGSPLGALLWPFWVPLEPSWGHLGPSWGHLGPS